jgi:Protein of unknown function (DUF2809)
MRFLPRIYSLVRQRPTPLEFHSIRACLCLGIIVCGLALRRYGLGIGLPALLVKYGGSLLWGAMVFFLVAIATPRLSKLHTASVATMIAVGVELLRLVHTPWLDQFRLTLPGALLLGRIFSPWDILAYGAGILFAMLLDHLTLLALANAPAPQAPS